MAILKPDQDRQKAREFVAKLKRNPGHTIDSHGFLGHSETSHVDVSDTELLDNILKKGTKRGDTVFTDKKMQRRFLEDALEAKSYEIAKFARAAKPGDMKIWYWQVFGENGEMETLGHGFIGTRDPSGDGIDISKPIRAITSNTGAFVIKKNPRAEDSWQLVTAFPVSRISPDIPETEREEAEIKTIEDFDFAPALHATDSYKSATPIQRTLLDYNNIARKTRPDLLPVEYVPRKNGAPEQIIIRHPALRYKDQKYSITGDGHAAATESGPFPVPEKLKNTVDYLMARVNEQITQSDMERRGRMRTRMSAEINRAAAGIERTGQDANEIEYT